MTTNRAPELKFKKGVLLTDEITVTLPAGEWVAFINWINSHDTDGINYLLYQLMFEQIAPQIYDAPSLKATEAHISDQPTTVEEWIKRQFPGSGVFPMHIPEREEGETRIQNIPGLDRVIVVCDTCGERDTYGGLPFGPLTCGHDGPRHGIAEA